MLFENYLKEKIMKPYWKHKNKKWVCPKHIPSAIIPVTISRCWFTNCSSVRPPIVRDTPLIPKCEWFKCDKDNGKPALRRKTSKYCSVDCKNKNARHAYNLRKKAKVI